MNIEEKELASYCTECIFDFHDAWMKAGIIKYGISTNRQLEFYEDKILPFLLSDKQLKKDFIGNQRGYAGVIICRAVQFGMISAYLLLSDKQKLSDMEFIKEIAKGPEPYTNSILSQIKMSPEEFYLWACQMLDEMWENKYQEVKDSELYEHYLYAVGTAAFKVGVSLMLDD